MPSPLLDADQSRAAAHRTGTACVAAAAGSGKTTLLVGRAIQLVTDGVEPREVVTLCFNTNAAITLRERLGLHPATAANAERMASTFHAYGRAAVSLVRRGVKVLAERPKGKQGQAQGAAAADEALQVDAPKAGEIEEAPMTERDMLSQAWAELRGDRYENGRRIVNRRRETWPAWMRVVTESAVVRHERVAREQLFDGNSTNTSLLDPARYEALLDRINGMGLREATNEVRVALAHLMPVYRRLKAEQNYIDYTDMLLGWVYYLQQNNPQVVEHLRRVKHLQIDEAQDGSLVRWYIARRHAELRRDGSTMAVGDLRQSIAGFAGARPELFQQWWDNADAKFTLPRNYRSASLIVAAGNVVARGEPWNLGGDCIAARTELGVGSVTVKKLGPNGIARDIAAEIAAGRITVHPTRRTAAGNPTYTVAVLARTRAALVDVAFYLRANQIYTRTRSGDEGVWVSGEGRAIRARYALQQGIVPLIPEKGHWVPDFAGTAMALNSDVNRYASTENVRRWSRLEKAATEADGSDAVWVLDRSLMEQHAREREAGRPARGAASARDCAQALGDFLLEGAMTWEERSEVVMESALTRIDADTEGARIPGREGPRGELVGSLVGVSIALAHTGDEDKLQALQAVVAAEMAPPPPGKPVVELATIHSSKGDEWGTVYLAAANDGILPHKRAEGADDVAEELRLLYVAVTRPVHTLVVDTEKLGRFRLKLEALAQLAAEGAAQPAAVQDFTPPPPPPAPIPAAPVAPPPAAGQAPDLSRLPSASALKALLEADLPRAKTLTAAGAKPAAGGRAVPVAFSELVELLDPAGFKDAGVSYGQRVLQADMNDGYSLKLNTGIPPNAEMARGVGEDSMRVMLVKDGKAKAPKQPIIARTVNWRTATLERLLAVLSHHPNFHR